MRLWTSYTSMMVETQAVITMRMMGMGGIWSVPNSENETMYAEKLPAFTEAMTAGAIAAMSGHAPDKVMQASMEPLTRKARKNRKRLVKRGPNFIK